MTLSIRLFDFLQLLLLNRYVFFVLLLLGYTRIMKLYGGLPSLMQAWRFEIPLLLYCYFFGNTITRKTPLQPVIVAAPIVLLYAVYDFYHLQFGRLPRLIALAEVPELMAVMPLWLKALLIAIIGTTLFIFFLTVRWGAVLPMTLGVLPLAGLFVAVESYPVSFMKAFEKTQKGIVTYSDVMSVANNGRISMTLYNEARRKSMREKTAHYLENPYYLLDVDKVIAKVKEQRSRRNVHLIVLESFLDPELLLDAEFSRNPAHPDFEKIFKRKGGAVHFPGLRGCNGPGRI